ncbi:MAG: hypothetical protein IPJ34_37790 [Myxococcales bacterium]|nr:hypothetical protein [Myxococcales bacterium]
MFHRLIPALFLLGACSSSEATSVDPATACEADCDRQVAAACAKTPASYATACKSFCEAGRKVTLPACLDLFNAQYTCSATKMTWSCTATGMLQGTPSGGCASEAAACAKCNGGKVCSAILP